MLSLIHRNHYLFDDDISINNKFLKNEIQNSSFLVLGGAGTIGQAVTKQIFKRSPKKLHVVDISENNLVELVRDIRSSYGYIKGDFKTFALDIGSDEYDAFFNDDGKYDYVFNTEETFATKWNDIIDGYDDTKLNINTDKGPNPQSIRWSHCYYLFLTLISGYFVHLNLNVEIASTIWLIFSITSFVDMYIFRQSGLLRYCRI